MSTIYDKIEYLKVNMESIQDFLKSEEIKDLPLEEQKEKVSTEFVEFYKNYPSIANKILNNDMEQINKFIEENEVDLSEPEMIRKKVIQIQNYVKTPRIKKLRNDKIKHEIAVREHFPVFEKRFPFLLKRIVNGHNLDFLEEMLAGLRSVRKGKATMEDVEVNLGNKLFKDFKLGQ